MLKILSLCAIIGIVATSPAFADSPAGPNGEFAVYFVAYNHASNNPQVNKALLSVDGGVTPALGNDGYVLESGSLSDLLVSIWSNSPGGQISDLTTLGVGPSQLAGLVTAQSQTLAAAICNPIEQRLYAPNSVAQEVTFSTISSCAIGNKPTISMTTHGQSSIHVTLTLPNNQIEGVLTTPKFVKQNQEQLKPPIDAPEPCVTENVGFTAETDITVGPTTLSPGKWTASFTNISPPGACNQSINFGGDSAALGNVFATGQTLAQSILGNLPLSATFAADLSAISKHFAAQAATLQMTPYEWNSNGNFGYFFLQQDPPKDFSGLLKGAVHFDSSLAPKLPSCNAFKLTSRTRIGATGVPNTWDHGQSYDQPNINAFGSYGSVRFTSYKPVVGATDATCPFTMTGLPLGYDTTFQMTGGVASGTTMSLVLPVDSPLNWSGETVVASLSLGDFRMTETHGVDVSHHVGTGLTTINATNSAAVLKQHGGGGDPAQDALVATRALSLNPHDYASLATLANADARLGKTTDARAQFTKAISLATIAHDTRSAAKFQAQLKAMGP